MSAKRRSALIKYDIPSHNKKTIHAEEQATASQSIGVPRVADLIPVTQPKIGFR